MNLQHLKYFQVVAKHQHITRAANELHIAQPALSKTIRSLEEELNTSLFVHKGRNIYLTETGRSLLKYAEQVDAEFENMHTELRHNEQNKAKVITILLKSTPLLVIQLVSRFREAFPDVSVNLITYNRNMLTSDVPYDLWIDSSIYESSHANSFTLLKEPLCLAVSSNSEFYNQEVDLFHAAHEDFISLPVFYNQGQELIELCRKAGFSPNIVLESSDYNTIQEMVAINVGIAIVPKYSWGFQRKSSISLSPIKTPLSYNYITLNWEKNRTPSKTTKNFISFVKELIQNDALELT